MSTIYGEGFYLMGGPTVPKASLTPKPGITYIAGLSGIEPATLTILAKTISNNANITNNTNTVYVDYGDIHRKIDVGSQVTIALNGTNYVFDVIGFNHDALTNANAYDSETTTGKAGITFQMHDLFATLYEMNATNTNIGGWKNSVMRTSTMPLMKGYMPAEWQSAIKPVDKKSGLGGGSSSGTETTSDDCFLLAEIEVFGSTEYSVSGEGTQYAYYKAGNSNVKKQGGNNFFWWERSPDSGGNDRFCDVGTKNFVSRSDADAHDGVAFGFCV